MKRKGYHSDLTDAQEDFLGFSAPLVVGRGKPMCVRLSRHPVQWTGVELVSVVKEVLT